MREITAALAGGGAALAASLLIWPVYVVVANLAAARDIDLPGAATEVLWGVPFGAVAGSAAASIAGLASQRAWPFTAFGSWLIWTCVLAMFLGLGAIPPAFVATGTLVALGTTVWVTALLQPTALTTALLRPRVGPRLVRSLLAGSAGFGVFFVAVVTAIAAEARSRPSGVSFGEWRRYMDGADLLGVTAVAIGAGAALALAIVTSDRRTVSVLSSLLAFGGLFIAAAPVLGFFSSCYVGETLLIFRWLVSPTC
ncbi:MAG TPA: hypothetical protein VGR85_10775 [Candidatus Limnocylindria bacterium]|nr:hypothetical protein [Candidatus Limnocylindria bacterium]